jgi:ABC-type lipoprotein release transport system permease subunit
MAFQEFKVGDKVTLFIPEGKHGAAEILSWRRLLMSGLVVIGIAVATMLAYHFLVEK